MGRMSGKVAVIVGGASGFGLACTEMFASEGANVVIAGRRGDLAKETAEKYGGLGVTWDVTNFNQGKEAKATIMDHFGGIDAAINFAGYDDVLSISEITPEHLEPMVNVQFNGAIYFLRFMCNGMAESGGGSAILCSSLTAHNPNVGRVGYAGAKAGIEYVAKLAAVEYGNSDVRINCIAPHVIETAMTAEMFKIPFAVESVRLQTPLKRMGYVEDVANCALYLACDESNYVNGETIRVDGGAHTQKLPSDIDYALLGIARPDLAAGFPRAMIPEWYKEELENNENT
ncbi:MAG TPA: SDR family oxidoreductase [Acidimicrobiales bacterium]|jgi:NAD(P)-dependent dehydrogenase (short-subunit alcohol dehydrogenase family)|nr:SDR family oxidoreductase [Acidimicrobiales bacterium]HJM29343.1 SDR family oxidoreductase [Acidimicrobiales bacterium]HJM96676.1 SDR family oxidoreductase [Acidimicrobiales bacterium]